MRTLTVQYDWSSLYPAHPNSRVEFADIGCGYGGLLVQLSPMFPSTLMIGNIFCVGVATFEYIVHGTMDRYGDQGEGVRLCAGQDHGAASQPPWSGELSLVLGEHDTHL